MPSNASSPAPNEGAPALNATTPAGADANASLQANASAILPQNATLAQNASTTATTQSTKIPDYPTADIGTAGIKMAGGLLLILGLLLVAMWMFKKIQAKGGFGATSGNRLKYVTQLGLGPKKSVVVVRFLNKVLVLGVTDTNINLLTEMEADDEQTANSQPNFAEVLGQRFKSRPDPDTPDQGGDPS